MLQVEFSRTVANARRLHCGAVLTFERCSHAAVALPAPSPCASPIPAQPGSLVGREHELGILLERWAWAKDGDGQVVLLSGEPGIGKIRTLRERLGDEPYTPLSQYCSPVPYQQRALPGDRALGAGGAAGPRRAAGGAAGQGRGGARPVKRLAGGGRAPARRPARGPDRGVLSSADPDA
jgi:hypothetical protein